jgi:hypothetical protein
LDQDLDSLHRRYATRVKNIGSPVVISPLHSDFFDIDATRQHGDLVLDEGFEGNRLLPELF